MAILREALAGVERGASTLPWADRRPWAVRTHVRREGDVPVIDLHDLNVRWALAVVDEVAEAELTSPEVWVVTGRGKHTGGVSTLRQAVGGRLRSRAADEGWRVYADSPGRLRVVFDPAAVARRAPSLLMILFVVAITAGLYATWAPLAVLPPAVAALLWWRAP